MSYVIGMKPGPDLGSKPFGNSRSLVSEISGRGVSGGSSSSCKHGAAPKITTSTHVRNNSKSDLKSTGLS